jgi:hypothetical protein
MGLRGAAPWFGISTSAAFSNIDVDEYSPLMTIKSTICCSLKIFFSALKVGSLTLRSSLFFLATRRLTRRTTAMARMPRFSHKTQKVSYLGASRDHRRPMDADFLDRLALTISTDS